jgi:hypothetical protein
MLLQFSVHVVAVVLTRVQTKQLRINIHKRNKTKTQYKLHYKNTVKFTYYQNTNTIVRTPTHYKSHKYTHSHITKRVKTTTEQDTTK